MQVIHIATEQDTFDQCRREIESEEAALSAPNIFSVCIFYFTSYITNAHSLKRKGFAALTGTSVPHSRAKAKKKGSKRRRKHKKKKKKKKKTINLKKRRKKEKKTLGITNCWTR
jgi:hypothetical protein